MPDLRESNWAEPIDVFHVDEALVAAPKGNVEGRRPVGPLQGFGQLWQKTFEVEIQGVTPSEVVTTWKTHFGEFWPSSASFYPPPGGINTGEVALIKSRIGPLYLTTGVRVIYQDETSWAYMNPEGHPWAAIITFSADERDEVTAVASIRLMVRANDPIYELGFKLGGSRAEDRLWVHTLTQLAKRFGVADPAVTKKVILIDKKRRWNEFSNLWKNSLIRTLLRRDRR